MFNKLNELSKRESVKVLGLMTGTSADGLDLVCVRFEGAGRYPKYEVLYSDEIPYPEEFSKAFKKPLELSASEIAQYDMKLGKWYGEVISKLDIEYDVIANHGQTLLHQPPDFTLQIGNAQCIADICQKPVISDFRTADVMLGGQGAPLIPVLDDFLLRDDKALVIALNMGGIANMTVLPPRGSNEPIFAWDTGPANTLIDKAVADHTGGMETYDKDGKYAANGVINEELLQFMLQHEYLNRKKPKSAGQEQFGNHYYHLLKNKFNPISDREWMSFIRTVTEMTIMSIRNDIKKITFGTDIPVNIVVSGGGAENKFIMQRLKEELSINNLIKFDLPGISSGIKEAFGFAYLGYLFLKRLPGNIPTVTGASRECVLGRVVL